MELTRKQLIYIQIFDCVLPFLRNIETHHLWRRLILLPILYGNFYPETELVHNLHRCIVYPEFNEGDIHWLNSQAKIYFKAGSKKNRPSYDSICKLIKELFKIVPNDLKEKLNWEGPQ